MKLRHFTLLWLVILVFMSYEYLVLNRHLNGPSMLSRALCGPLEHCAAGKKLTPDAGKPLSYSLGWLGFSTMALTNAYIIRKRVPQLGKVGNLQGWLDWHIFFGLLGPTLILFHCNFKVGGLVAISFWSMVISFLSGIVGRYFYIQLQQSKVSLKQDIDTMETQFDQYVKASQSRVTEHAMLAAKARAFAMAGGLQGHDLRSTPVAIFLLRSMIGEARMMVALPSVPWRGSNRVVRRKLKAWAILRRRLLDTHYYHLLFGYWRTFHSPFAIWMYVVAIIHIVSSLIFRVSHG